MNIYDLLVEAFLSTMHACDDIADFPTANDWLPWYRGKYGQLADEAHREATRRYYS